MKLKNLRFSLMALAVILAAGTALATNVKAKAQRAETLYYKTSVGTYAVAGIEGYDFLCEGPVSGPCTYTLSDGTYKPYRYGTIKFLR
jgi:hypothetical protein